MIALGAVRAFRVLDFRLWSWFWGVWSCRVPDQPLQSINNPSGALSLSPTSPPPPPPLNGFVSHGCALSSLTYPNRRPMWRANATDRAASLQSLEEDDSLQEAGRGTQKAVALERGVEKLGKDPSSWESCCLFSQKNLATPMCRPFGRMLSWDYRCLGLDTCRGQPQA